MSAFPAAHRGKLQAIKLKPIKTRTENLYFFTMLLRKVYRKIKNPGEFREQFELENLKILNLA